MFENLEQSQKIYLYSLFYSFFFYHCTFKIPKQCQAWWHMPSILAWGMEGAKVSGSLWVWGQPGIHSELQDRQNYTETLSQQTEQKHAHKQFPVLCPYSKCIAWNIYHVQGKITEMIKAEHKKGFKFNCTQFSQRGKCRNN